MFEGTLRLIWKLFDTLTTQITPIFQVLNTEYEVVGIKFSLFEILFGGGMIAIFTVRISMWLVELVIPN